MGPCAGAGMLYRPLCPRFTPSRRGRPRHVLGGQKGGGGNAYKVYILGSAQVGSEVTKRHRRTTTARVVAPRRHPVGMVPHPSNVAVSADTLAQDRVGHGGGGDQASTTGAQGPSHGMRYGPDHAPAQVARGVDCQRFHVAGSPTARRPSLPPVPRLFTHLCVFAASLAIALALVESSADPDVPFPLMAVPDLHPSPDAWFHVVPAAYASHGSSLLTPCTSTSGANVDSVQFTSDNGVYGIGDTIGIRITTGTLGLDGYHTQYSRLQLETGDTDRFATFVSRTTGTNGYINYVYTVQTGDNSDDLDYKSAITISAWKGPRT